MTQYCARCGGIFSAKMNVEYGHDDKPRHSYCAWVTWREERKKLEDNQRKEVIILTAENSSAATPHKAV